MITVTKWISDSETGEYKEAPVGGWGGWFNFNEGGKRWKDYLDHWKPEAHPYLEAIRASVLERNLRYNGSEHQNAVDGVPVFSDGTCATFSFRGWGDIMAAIWSEAEDKDYNYMDFYC